MVIIMWKKQTYFLETHNTFKIQRNKYLFERKVDALQNILSKNNPTK